MSCGVQAWSDCESSLESCFTNLHCCLGPQPADMRNTHRIDQLVATCTSWCQFCPTLLQSQPNFAGPGHRVMLQACADTMCHEVEVHCRPLSEGYVITAFRSYILKNLWMPSKILTGGTMTEVQSNWHCMSKDHVTSEYRAINMPI